MEKIPSWLRWILFLPAGLITWYLVDDITIGILKDWQEYGLVPWWIFIPPSYVFYAITSLVGPVMFLAVVIGIAPTENKCFRVSLCLVLAYILNFPQIYKLSNILRGRPVVLNQFLGVPFWYALIMSIINLIIIGAIVVNILSKKSARSPNQNNSA
jgi:hypothetical protein